MARRGYFCGQGKIRDGESWGWRLIHWKGIFLGLGWGEMRVRATGDNGL